MQALIYDLGYQKKGTTIEIKLPFATNVRLFDKVNCDLFRNKQKHTFYGGYVKVSPYRMAIPEEKHWYIAVDVQGDTSNVNVGINVVPPKLRDVPQ